MLKYLTVVLFLVTTTAYANQNSTPFPCDLTPVVHNLLTEEYSEVPESVELLNEDAVLEIWGNKETGSFTVLITSSKGKTCMVHAGKDWTKTEGTPL